LRKFRVTIRFLTLMSQQNPFISGGFGERPLDG